MMVLGLMLYLLGAAARLPDTTCRETIPRPGRIVLGGFVVGPPTSFVNDIQVSQCFPLSREGRLAAWVSRLHVWEGRIVVERCENEIVADTQPGKGEQLGGTTGQLEEVSLTGGGVSFGALTIPDWSLVAQPTFCRGRVAYWATTPRSDGTFTVSLQVWDLASRQVLARSFFRNDRLETDYSYYLPTITWDADGRTVHSGRVSIVVRTPN